MPQFCETLATRKNFLHLKSYTLVKSSSSSLKFFASKGVNSQLACLLRINARKVRVRVAFLCNPRNFYGLPRPWCSVSSYSKHSLGANDVFFLPGFGLFALINPRLIWLIIIFGVQLGFQIKLGLSYKWCFLAAFNVFQSEFVRIEGS